MMRQKISYILIALVILLVLVFVLAQQNTDVDKFQVVFFDVGQGDSHFIRTPGGQNILIDGGNNSFVLEKLAKYMPLQSRAIDLMILTHPHSDHVSGLNEALNRYQVERVLSTGAIHTTNVYLAWLNAIKEQEIQFDKAIAPKQYVFQNSGDPVTLSVLYPYSDLSEKEVPDLNDTSVVVMVEYNGKKFLFTGDISVDVEKQIIDSGVDLKADVLKVAHQGSDTSTSEEWIEAVRPDYAIIPVGENNYGHPSINVIKRLEEAGARVSRTDEDGDIRFIVDQNGILELN